MKQQKNMQRSEAPDSIRIILQLYYKKPIPSERGSVILLKTTLSSVMKWRLF